MKLGLLPVAEVEGPAASKVEALRVSSPAAATPDGGVTSPGVLSPRTERRTWGWLGANHDEATELAAVLHEATLLQLPGYRTPQSNPRLPHKVSIEPSQNLGDRLRSAAPVPIGAGQVDWSRLTATISSEIIKFEVDHCAPPAPSPCGAAGAGLASPRPHSAGTQLLEINSGGRVYFCLFSPEALNPAAAAAASPAAEGGGGSEQDGAEGPPPPPLVPPEGCLVIKFVGSRLLCQSEQFATELTRHVGLCAPDSRILRSKGASEAEWAEAAAAAAALSSLHPELHDEMGQTPQLLLLEFIPGRGLLKGGEAFAPQYIQQTAEDLGRLFTLDMVLGNGDRLPCEALAWRGNPENLMFAQQGRWAGRVVALDALVSRRPPGGLLSSEDAACDRLTELALNDVGVAASALAEAVSSSPEAAAAVKSDDAVIAFQRGLKAALTAALGMKGLLEMMFGVMEAWMSSFVEDIESSYDLSGPRSGGGGPGSSSRRASATGSAGGGGGGGGQPSPAGSSHNTTFKIRLIQAEAQVNGDLGERVAQWAAVFRERTEELRAAVEEWQLKRAPGEHRLTTGFLEGSHPLVDTYELKVRLEHMLKRLRVLQEATATERPTWLLPRLFLSGAMGAESHHLLRHLGVTHILNATEDLLPPDLEKGFTLLRVPLRDVEEEEGEIGGHFPAAVGFIDRGLASGGGVLVHCHAGVSRSCSLVLAWLMTRRAWTLRRALGFLRRRRPEAAPNAGYLSALLRLEEELFGTQTMTVRRTKPEPKLCPVCGEKTGLSAESVTVHMRRAHPQLRACISPTVSNASAASARSCGESPLPSLAQQPQLRPARDSTPRERGVTLSPASAARPPPDRAQPQ